MSKKTSLKTPALYHEFSGFLCLKFAFCFHFIFPELFVVMLSCINPRYLENKLLNIFTVLRSTTNNK